MGLVAVLVLSLGLVTGCLSDTQPEETAIAFSVTDDRGITIDFDEPVDYLVVSLALLPDGFQTVSRALRHRNGRCLAHGYHAL